ncbi:MAG: hypothetical protein ACJ786_35985 [Catenulispora sp.]
MITRAPRKLVPRDALCKGEVATRGLFVCKGCGWAFRYVGGGEWAGAYWPHDHEWDRTHDSLKEWSGYPRILTTEQLEEQYADCFGRLTFREPALQRMWAPVHRK